MLGPIGNDVKYGFILSKTLRIRTILEIILVELIFFLFALGFNTFLHSLLQKWVALFLLS